MTRLAQPEASTAIERGTWPTAPLLVLKNIHQAQAVLRVRHPFKGIHPTFATGDRARANYSRPIIDPKRGLDLKPKQPP